MIDVKLLRETANTFDGRAYGFDMSSDDVLELLDRLEAAEREAGHWKDCAAQYARNEDFYRDIVYQIGELFGEEARTSDDGSVQDDVLALKVPELVEALAAHVERQRETLQWIWDKVNLGGWAHERVKTALADTPDTSLARLKAKWQAEAVVEFGFRYGPETEVRADSQRVANKIHHQAEGGES